MRETEAEQYINAVREAVFTSTIRAIAKARLPQNVSAATKSLSLYATVDGLIMASVELMAEGGLLNGHVTEAELLDDLTERLARHMQSAKFSMGIVDSPSAVPVSH